MRSTRSNACLAFLLADDVAEDAAEQPDVFDQRLVVLGAPHRRLRRRQQCYSWPSGGCGDASIDVPTGLHAGYDVSQLDHRHPRKPARPLAGRAREGAAANSAGTEVSLLRHDDARRPDPRPLARQGRRQGPVRQGAREGARGRPGRPRGAFAEGRADGPARGLRARRVLEREDPRDAFVSDRSRLAGGRCRRARGSAPRACAAWCSCARCGPTCGSSRCAATSTRGCASSTTASTTPSCWPPPACKRLGLGAAHPRAASSRPRCCPRAGQGALGIEMRADAARSASALAPLDAPADLARGAAERAVVARAGRQLQHAARRARRLARDRLELRAGLGDPERLDAVLRAKRRRADRRAGAEALGSQVAEALLAQGAAADLAAGARPSRPRPDLSGPSRLVVTRPARRPSAWVEQLRRARRRSLAAAADRDPAPLDPQPLAAAWQGSAVAALVMFVSANAVAALLRRAARGRGLAGARCSRRRPGRAPRAALLRQACRRRRSSRRPTDAAQFDSEACGQRCGQRDWRGRSVLLVRGDGGRDWLAEQLADGRRARSMRSPPTARLAPSCRPRSAALAPPPRRTQRAWLFSSSEAVDLLRLRRRSDWRRRARAGHPSAHRGAARARPVSATFRCGPASTPWSPR